MRIRKPDKTNDHRPALWRARSLVALSLASVLGICDAAETRIRYDQPAQALAAALDAIAKTSGLKLLYADAAVQGRQAAPLRGHYTTEEALQTVLGDSGLHYEFVGENMVAVKDSPGEGSEEVKRSALPEMTVTAAPVDGSLGTPSLEESREMLGRVPGGTTVLDGERLREGAAYSVGDALSYAPGVYVGDFGGGIAGGSRISVRGSDIASPISPILGIKVLRDGFPLTNANGATDTESINLFAIDHIEVYRGANALQYGASNLGGAINIVSPTGYTSPGLKLGMTAGTDAYVLPQQPC